MNLTATLSQEEWQFVLEVLNLNQTIQIKNTAISLLKGQLEEQLKSKSNVKDEKHTVAQT